MKGWVSRAVPSILNADLTIVGNIMSKGEVHILGALKGDLTADKLTLGEGGTIEGKIEAETAVINGNVSGSISAKSVLLGRTASVTADIVYVSMGMETGAVHNGHARHVDGVETISGEVMELPITKGRQISSLRPGGRNAFYA